MNERLMDDLRREAKKANRIDKDRAEQLKALLNHPGWLTYATIVQTQVQAHSEALLEPATGVDSLVASECIKGTMRGLLLALALPSTIIEQMKSLRQEQEAAAAATTDEKGLDENEDS